MHLESIVVVLALAGLGFSSPFERSAKKHRNALCQELVVPVTVEAMNIQLPNKVNVKDPLGFILTADPTQITLGPVNGTYDISMRYCEPEIRLPGRSNTLQILGHGNTYDKTYWSGLEFPGYQPSNYSWMDYASKQGYPTLSMDRLGNGASAHPDPISVVQLPVHIEVLHQIASLALSGNLLKNTVRSFSKIVYAGHSYGSFIGNGHSAKYPSEIDAYILTGFTSQPLQLAAPGVIATAKYLPASLVNPARFPNLALGYLWGTSKSGRETGFYTTPSVDFDPAIYELDWATSGTLTIGEAASETTTNASNYIGSVFVLTGRNDTIFCGLGTGQGDCGEGSTSIAAKTKELYPNVKNFGYFVPNNVGHDWNLHFAAPQGFRKAHDWLASIGL